ERWSTVSYVAIFLIVPLSILQFSRRPLSPEILEEYRLTLVPEREIVFGEVYHGVAIAIRILLPWIVLNLLAFLFFAWQAVVAALSPINESSQVWAVIRPLVAVTEWIILLTVYMAICIWLFLSLK